MRVYRSRQVGVGMRSAPCADILGEQLQLRNHAVERCVEIGLAKRGGFTIKRNCESEFMGAVSREGQPPQLLGMPRDVEDERLIAEVRNPRRSVFMNRKGAAKPFIVGVGSS